MKNRGGIKHASAQLTRSEKDKLVETLTAVAMAVDGCIEFLNG